MELTQRPDILENLIDKKILEELLRDHTTGENIIWATDDYESLGEDYRFSSQITVDSITGDNGMVIMPRIEKDKKTQAHRSRDKAEVFTPSWICNAQNNMIDDAWFGKHSNRFNKETGTTWESTYPRKKEGDTRDRICFPKKNGKGWTDYVEANRLEMSCGEAPYLTSRYDTTTGKYIKPKNRIGLLDRKLRVIYENVDTPEEWLKWAEVALQSTYGFEWQGDNILLARENLLLATAETFKEYYDREIPKRWTMKYAMIISWNIWQMDGIKFVIPNSCKKESQQMSFIPGTEEKETECPGCKTGNIHMHNGIYANIKDWKEKKVIRFVDMMQGGSYGKI